MSDIFRQRPAGVLAHFPAVVLIVHLETLFQVFDVFPADLRAEIDLRDPGFPDGFADDGFVHAGAAVEHQRQIAERTHRLQHFQMDIRLSFIKTVCVADGHDNIIIAALGVDCRDRVAFTPGATQLFKIRTQQVDRPF